MKKLADVFIFFLCFVCSHLVFFELGLGAAGPFKVALLTFVNFFISSVNIVAMLITAIIL